jgi:outer membrane receptor protein involved in Fe transport
MREKLLIAVSAASLLTGADTAVAQEAASKDVVIVTGTRIPRKDFTAASPVSTFDRAEIRAQGATALEEFLNTLPQIKPDLGKTSNNPGDGSASIDLRGLGRGRTLVLINGRRVAPTGTGSAIDANAIPAAMIERVEIVSGGASAVYGSDAVTGAVNFITRKNFTGLELDAQADVYGAGDGVAYNASIAGGFRFADDRGHVAVFADYLKREPVLQGDRAFSAVVLNESGGVLVPSGSPSVPAGRTVGGGPSLLFQPDGTIRPFSPPSDLYNFAPANYLQTPLQRWSAGAFAEYETAGGVEFYSELMYSRPQTAAELAPALSTFSAPLVIDGPFFDPSARPTLTARFDPDLDGIGVANISKRFEDVGPRITGAQRHYWRAVAGFRADIAPDWSLEAFYSYGRNGNKQSLDNAVSLSRVRQGLLIDPVTGLCVDPSDGCVAVNIFGVGNITAEARDFIIVNGLENTYRSVQHNAALIATGDVFSWSQGTVQFSGGLEYRRNIASSQADPALETGDALGFSTFAGAEGAISVYETFGELLVPVLDGQPFAEHLELELGGRYSHYSSAGGVWTWKAGGQWMPFEGLRFSGMWQRAVRAPNVEELFQVPVADFGVMGGSEDICAAANDPAGAGLFDVCVAQGMDPAAVGVYDPPANVDLLFDVVSGGNPDLRSERAGSITAGFDYTFDAPMLLRIGADFFEITLQDAITFIDDAGSLCAIVKDPSSEICRLIHRAPAGDPLFVEHHPLNLAIARTKGIDFSFDFSGDFPALGHDASFAVRSAATYYLEFGEQQALNAPFIDCAGFYHSACGVADTGGINASVVFPKSLVTTSFSLTKGNFTGGLRWRWLAGVENLEPLIADLGGQPPPLLAITHVDAKNYVDLSASYEIRVGITLRAGVDNVLKTSPPLLGSQQVQANTDPSRYDVFGRRFFAGLNLRF